MAIRRCCGSWPTASRKADGPTHMAVILDASEQTFRNEMYDQYKAHRPPPPEDLVPQFPLIRVATRAFSIPCIEEAGLEADDIIACYVTAASKAGWRVTIVSSDKDLMQLIDEEAGIDMLDTMNDRRIGREQVLEKFGVPPGEGRRRAGADGRQRRQCAGRAGDRAEDRLAADPAVRRPGDRARLDRPDHQAQAQAVADRPCRQCAAIRELVRLVCDVDAAGAARSAGAQGHSARAAAGVPGGPGVQDPARAVGGGGGAPTPRSSSGAGFNDVMASLDRKPQARRPRPRRSRSTGPSTRRSPTKPRSTAGSRKRGAGLCRARHRDRLHRLHHRQAGRDQPGDRAQLAPATSPSGTAAWTCCPKRPTSCARSSCSAS